MPKPQIEITTQAGVEVRGDSYFTAAVHRIDDHGNRTPVLDGEGRPLELAASTEEGARQRAVKALDDKVFGEGQYELVEKTFTLGESRLDGPDTLG